jgi:RNA polymerase sigma factor (sigma-70 family)
MIGPHIRAAQDRDDLIQEVWLTIARKLPQFCWNENRGGFRAWFAKVVHDKTVDLIRRGVRRTATLSSLSEDQQEPVDSGHDPTVNLERRWQEDVVHVVLAEIRAEVGELNFQILHLHFWDNCTVAEIADHTGLTPEQVSARQCRLLKKVRGRIYAYCGQDFTPVFG